MQEPPIALRVNDAVRLSSLSRSSIYRLLEAKELPSARVNGRRLILREDLEAYLRARREVA